MSKTILYIVMSFNGYGDFHTMPRFLLTHRPPNKDARENVPFTGEPIKSVVQQAKKGLTEKNIWVVGGGIVT